MGTISITTPSDGQTIDASDVATPLNTIVTEINGSLDSNNIADGGVVPNNLTSGTGTSWVWQSYTPTFTNITEGNGTKSGYYTQIGKTVHFFVKFTMGSTSSMGSDPTVSLPVTADSNIPFTEYIAGNVHIRDFGTAVYHATCRIKDSTTAGAYAYTAGGTYVGIASISSVAPMTWATNDTIVWVGTYPAA